MITQKLLKLKKYLFLISILFLFISIFHLTYVYLYEDSKVIPVKGGTISEGLIGNFPSLNPLKNLSGNNQYVVGLLYRSLLKYDLKENKITGDIANCDLSSLVNIECYISDDAKWSNGEKITALDIYSTYELIRSTNSNIILKSLLEDTKIEYSENIITFKNNKKDVNFQNIFFQPIISKTTIDNLSKENIFGNFPTNGGIYSGNFKISSVSSDLTIGVSKIILDKNENYNIGNISKIILNIFPDVNTFLKNKQSVNIFNDDSNLVGSSIPRMQSYKYSLPQFVGLFINQNKITDVNFRNYIFSKINSQNLVDLLGKDNYSVINNPYLSSGSIDKEPNIKNFESVMKSLGYSKKSKYIDDLMPKDENQNSEVEIKAETAEVKDLNNLTIDEFQKKSEIIIKPTYVEKYNFITKDDILLEGKVTSNVTDVYINDNKLEGFKPGNETFLYRLKLSYNNIKEGKNNYKIYFVVNNEKIFKEEINFLFNSNKDKLKIDEIEYVKELYNESIKKIETPVITNNQPKKDISELIDKDKFDRVNKLDENIYYDKDLNPYTLRLYYLNTENVVEQTAYFIKNSLKELGIDTELIPFNLVDVAKILSNKDDYDMILTGVNLGYFEYNIFPYFHSSQSKSGYNFSNIKKTSLDILLEDLKSNILSKEKIQESENKILEILKEEQVIKTLYTPKINLLVDKNLKNEVIYDKIPNKFLRSYILNSSYIKEDKLINFDDKNISNFFKFILKKLYE